MKILPLLLWFAFSASADSFQWTKDKMQEIFDLEYKDDIVFGKVYYNDIWDCIDEKYNIKVDHNIAFFNNFYTKERNDIYILKTTPNSPFDTAFMESVLVHEYAHFLQKKRFL